MSWTTTDKYVSKWKNKGLVKSVSKPAFSTKLGKPISKKAVVLDTTVLKKLFSKRKKSYDIQTIENLEVLCKSCHKKEEIKLKKGCANHG